jgi:phage gp29-like protein
MAPRPSSIIDPSTGKPFLLESFDREISGPTVSGVRRHPSVELYRGITPQRLASILLEVKGGSSAAFFELAEEMEERDPHYASVLGTRKRAVSQLAVKVTAASERARDKEIADALRKWTQRKRLQAELFDLMDAVGKGISISEIVWDRRATPWMPARLCWRPMSWFRQDPIDRDLFRLRVDGNTVHGEDLQPGKWIVHRHPAKTGLSVRSGIAYIIAYSVMFTTFTVADWMAFADTYGQPFRLGKYPPGTDERAQALLHDAVSMMGADAAATVPSSMTIDIVQAAKSDGAMFGALASYFNRLKSKLVLGQEATTEAISGGHAVSKEQNEVRGDIRDADAVLVADTLQEQLVDVWTAINYGPDVDPPILSLDFEENEDVKAVLDGAFGIADRGGKVQVKQLRDKLGLVEPAAGDELLGRSGGRISETPPGEVGEVPPALRRPRLAASNGKQVAIAANAAAAAKREAEVQDRLLAALEDAGQPVIDGWLDRIREALNAASSLEDLGVRLLELYPELETDDLTTLIGQALALSNVSGRDLDA